METEEDDYQQIVLNIRYAGREWMTTRNYPRSRYTSSELKCPTCMTMNPVHNKDVTSLTKNFALLSCLQQQPSHRNKHFCKDHNHEKRIFCNDCQTLICAYCQLYGGHAGHKYEVATDAAKPSLATLKEAESGIQRDLEKLGDGRKAVGKAMRRLGRSMARSEKEVKMYYEGAMERLKEEMERLLRGMSSWSREQQFVLQSQLE